MALDAVHVIVLKGEDVFMAKFFAKDATLLKIGRRYQSKW